MQAVTGGVGLASGTSSPCGRSGLASGYGVNIDRTGRSRKHGQNSRPSAPLKGSPVLALRGGRAVCRVGTLPNCPAPYQRAQGLVCVLVFWRIASTSAVEAQLFAVYPPRAPTVHGNPEPVGVLERRTPTFNSRCSAANVDRHQPSRLSRCGEARHDRRHELASKPQRGSPEGSPPCDAPARQRLAACDDCRHNVMIKPL